MACVLAIVLAAAGSARGFDDPDTEVARRHFEKGRGFYDRQDYRHALDEFLAAKRAKAAPALDFNIARCHDRLEEYPMAIQHYELYLAARSNAPDAADVRERIAALRKRADEIASARTPTPVPPPVKTGEPDKLLPPPAFAEESAAPVLVAPAPTPTEETRARRRTGAIIGGVIGGVVVIGGAIALGVLLSRPTRPDYYPSTLPPMAGTQ